MHTIWKFPIKIQDKQAIELPKGFIVRSLQEQHGQPCLWIEVNPTLDKATHLLYVYGTGHPIPDPSSQYYIGTYIQFSGNLVWHVFISNEPAIPS